MHCLSTYTALLVGYGLVVGCSSDRHYLTDNTHGPTSTGAAATSGAGNSATTDDAGGSAGAAGGSSLACASLSLSGCRERDDCSVLSAQVDGPNGEDVPFVACTQLRPCGDRVACAWDGEDGQTLRFPSSCIPDGWLETECIDVSPSEGTGACETLGEGECREQDGCSVISARVEGPDGEDVPFVACTGAETCGGAEICAWDGEDGQTLRFPSTCIPDGWLETECVGAYFECPDSASAECEEREHRACGFDIQAGPDQPEQRYDCIKDGGGTSWRCWCDGAGQTGSGSDCETALQDACGVAIPERGHCTVGEAGCWPVDAAGEPSTAAGDTWACRCTGADRLSTVSTERCDDALFQHCAEGCSGEAGTCMPTVTEGEYACLCTYYGGPERVLWSQEACPNVLEAACDPTGHGGSGCNAFAGYCDQTDSGFSCRCIDGRVDAVRYTELPEDQCELALELICGVAEPNSKLICDDERTDGTTTWRGECTREDPGIYACECSYSGLDEAGARGERVEAATCSEALESCFP
jgi:hypothetical protein